MDVVNDSANFEDDFQFLKELKDILIENAFRLSEEFPDRSACDSEVKNGICSETDDKREVRIVLPGGLQNVLDHLELLPDDITSTTKVTESRDDLKELCFVGFLGQKKDRSEMEESVVHDINKTDAVVVQELSTIDGMIAYVTGERLKGGDYGNLVVFKNKGVVKNLKQSQNHAYAVNSISPRYYRTVRIHSGRLPIGLRSPYFVLQKTLFLQFSLPAEDPARRRVQLWRACRKDSNFFKVFSPTKEI